jgi:flagellar hook protein FlgE
MSFDIALSGIQAINDALDVTSHNIANAGTYGYKSSRANFSTLVAGSNPTGVQVGSVSQSIGLAGGILNTGDNLNASVNGRGFFITKGADGTTQYTRVGLFDVSKDGFMIDASGRKVQAYSIVPPSTTPTGLGNVPIPNGQIPAVASGLVNFSGNLSADWPATTPPDVTLITPDNPPGTTPATYNLAKTTQLFDSLGGTHDLVQYFSAGAVPGEVHVTYTIDGQGVGTSDLKFGADGKMAQLGDDPEASPPNYTFALPLTGVTLPASTTGGKLSDSINIDYTGMTRFAGEPTIPTNNADGYSAANYAGLELAKDGSIVAKYSNGAKQTVGIMALATFADEAALTSVSDTSWIASSASGGAIDSRAGTNGTGALNVATVEQSNVDITSELVGLMTSQRNYQANSKVIQTESTMLQSLMQAI